MSTKLKLKEIRDEIMQLAKDCIEACENEKKAYLNLRSALRDTNTAPTDLMDKINFSLMLLDETMDALKADPIKNSDLIEISHGVLTRMNRVVKKETERFLSESRQNRL